MPPAPGAPPQYNPSPAPPPPAYGAAPPPPGYQAYTPSPASGDERAGFGGRLGGWILDYILYGLVVALFAVPGFILIVTAFSDCVSIGDDLCAIGEPNGGTIALGGLLIAVGVILVFILYVRALGKTGQTWGRKIAGVKVVGEMTGQPIGIGKAIGRQLFAGIISGQVFYLGYLWMLWDDKKQTWHDKVVGSIVIKA